jgi:hypothetical protein
MKRLGILLVCILVVTVSMESAQTERVLVSKTSTIKQTLESEMSVQAVVGDKVKGIIFNVMPLTSSDGITLDVFHNIRNIWAQNTGIMFTAEISALKVADVNVHFIITGPEQEWEESGWGTISKNTVYFYTLTYQGSWTKGLYKLTVILEEDSGGAATASTAECYFRIVG